MRDECYRKDVRLTLEAAMMCAWMEETHGVCKQVELPM